MDVWYVVDMLTGWHIPCVSFLAARRQCELLNGSFMGAFEIIHRDALPLFASDPRRD